MNSRSKYREFCLSQSDMSIFIKDWWLDLVCGEDNWDAVFVEKGGHVVGVMPYSLQKRKGLSIISQPNLTQTMGAYICYPAKQKNYKKLSLEKEVISKLLSSLPKFDKFTQSLNFEVRNILPYLWNGYQSKVFFTYVVEPTSIATFKEGLHSDIKRRVKRANELGITVSQSNNIEEFYSVNKDTFDRKGLSMPYSLDFVKSLFDGCKKHNACTIFTAKDSRGKAIASSFLVSDSKTVYYLMGGVSTESKHLGGMDIVLIKSIEFALNQNKRFDFEGSMVESIEKYFRSFGAEQMPYYHIYKTHSKLIKLREFIREVMK